MGLSSNMIGSWSQGLSHVPSLWPLRHRFVTSFAFLYFSSRVYGRTILTMQRQCHRIMPKCIIQRSGNHFKPQDSIPFPQVCEARFWRSIDPNTSFRVFFFFSLANWEQREPTERCSEVEIRFNDQLVLTCHDWSHACVVILVRVVVFESTYSWSAPFPTDWTVLRLTLLGGLIEACREHACGCTWSCSKFLEFPLKKTTSPVSCDGKTRKNLACFWLASNSWLLAWG